MMVREEGVEPSCLAALASETSASAIPPPPRFLLSISHTNNSVKYKSIVAG